MQFKTVCFNLEHYFQLACTLEKINKLLLNHLLKQMSILIIEKKNIVPLALKFNRVTPMIKQVYLIL